MLILSAKKETLRASHPFSHPFLKDFLDYLPVLVVSGGDKRVRISIIILTRLECMISHYCAKIMNGGSGWPSYLPKNNIARKDSFSIRSLPTERKRYEKNDVCTSLYLYAPVPDGLR